MTITPDRHTLEMIAVARLLPPVYGRQPGCKGVCARLYPDSKKSRGINQEYLTKKCSRCQFWAKTEDNRCRCCNTMLGTRAY